MTNLQQTLEAEKELLRSHGLKPERLKGQPQWLVEKTLAARGLVIEFGRDFYALPKIVEKEQGQ